MFDKNLTPAEYKALSNTRAGLARQLLIEALQDHIPAGYVLSVDPDRMYGNALLALRPAQVSDGTKMICFIHAINFIQNATWAHVKLIALNISFTLTHTYFGGFRGDRSIRENSNPIFSCFSERS